MSEKLGEILLNYGALGVMVIGLSWYILRRDKENKEERKEWQAALNNNTNVLTAIKTLLETTRERKR